MIHRGTIVGLFGQKGSGIAMLGIEDDEKGRVLIPCDGNPTCRMLNVVFPGALRDGTFYNDAIVGERIYYELDEGGVLKGFAPEDRAPEEKIAEYEKQTSPSKKGMFTFGGFLPPDHPLYSSGPIVAGREIGKPGTHRRGGFLPDDHWLYKAGPVVAGKPIQEKKKGRFINMGLCKPDDPIYSTGPVVNGRPILKKGRFIDRGWCKPDDPIYRSGPIVQGRQILKKKPTDN